MDVDFLDCLDVGAQVPLEGASARAALPPGLVAQPWRPAGAEVGDFVEGYLEVLDCAAVRLDNGTVAGATRAVLVAVVVAPGLPGAQESRYLVETMVQAGPLATALARAGIATTAAQVERAQCPGCESWVAATPDETVQLATAHAAAGLTPGRPIIGWMHAGMAGGGALATAVPAGDADLATARLEATGGFLGRAAPRGPVPKASWSHGDVLVRSAGGPDGAAGFAV